MMMSIKRPSSGHFAAHFTTKRNLHQKHDMVVAAGLTVGNTENTEDSWCAPGFFLHYKLLKSKNVAI